MIPTAVTSSRAVSIGESFRLFALSAKISITRRPMGGGVLGRLRGWAPVRTDSPVEDRGFELPVPPEKGMTAETCRS